MGDSALIVCIGNDLAADDGAGPAVYHCLARQTLPVGVRLVLLGVGGIALLEELDGEDRLVVVDAVRFGSRPGTVHVLPWDDIPAGAPHPVSGHGIGVREAVDVGRRLTPEKMPRAEHLVGIEGSCFDMLGAGLSAEVAAAVDDAAARVLGLVC